MLCDLQRRLETLNKSLEDFGIAVPELPDNERPAITSAYLPHNVTLQPDQQEVFDAIDVHLRQPNPAEPLFVQLEGEPGGGKSFVLNVLINHARSLGHNVIACAFPAKVALKFEGGQTIHHHLGLRPSNVGDEVSVDLEAPTASGARNAAQRRADAILRARLICADEITMMRSDELDAIVDKLTQLGFKGVFNITGNSAQLGPVMPGKGIAEQIAYNSKNARNWDRFKHMRLTGQQRCKDDELRQAIHDIGYGKWPSIDGSTHIATPACKIRMPTTLFPAKVASLENIEAARAWAHGDVTTGVHANGMLGSIVCATNELADNHNAALLTKLTGDTRTYTARDVVKKISDGNAAFNTAVITPDTSKVLKASGAPAAEIQLKIGAPVHLMLSIDKSEGLVKGQLATVAELNRHTVAIRLLSPKHPDRALWHIPRMCFTFKPSHMPVEIVRHQLPLRLAWASTVHRVQGDDLNRVVVDLRHPFFAHGQLEVAISRGHGRNETLYLVDEKDFHGDSFDTLNVVLPQVLCDDC